MTDRDDNKKWNKALNNKLYIKLQVLKFHDDKPIRRNTKAELERFRSLRVGNEVKTGSDDLVVEYANSRCYIKCGRRV